LAKLEKACFVHQVVFSFQPKADSYLAFSTVFPDFQGVLLTVAYNVLWSGYSFTSSEIRQSLFFFVAF
jgi:hypothetical protein